MLITLTYINLSRAQIIKPKVVITYLDPFKFPKSRSWSKKPNMGPEGAELDMYMPTNHPNSMQKARFPDEKA